MATIESASIIPLHQPKRPMTPAERARNYRRRKLAKANGGTIPVPPSPTLASPSREQEPSRASRSITSPVTPSRHSLASIMLTMTAFGLAGVGLTMNGWFSKSLGSSDIAGWLFLAIGVAADLVALAVPACAASLWQTRQRGTAAAAWTIWAMSFAFVVTAGIGFASTNIADVTMSRASRVTPAVTTAQAALADAMSARDRECKGGQGKFCREREAAVNDRRHALDVAMKTVEKAADPQTEAAAKMVAWLTGGVVRPGEADFAMLRLILLALLPQVGGLLLMVGRRA
jgi:hypothetical protein